MLTLGLFGALTWHTDGEPRSMGGRPAELLALIALEHATGKPAQRGVLAGRMFPDLAEANARRLLNNMLYRLRQALGSAESHLDVDADGIGLRDAHSDLLALRLALRSAAPDALSQALQQPPDALFVNFDAEWASTARAALREEVLTVLPRAMQKATPAQTLTLLHAWLRLDPSDEAACAQAMRLHMAQGRGSDALALFAACKTALERDLDQPPGAELQALANAVRAERETADAPTDIFVGRQRERSLASAWLQNATAPPVLLIEGDPGIGKTALGQAIGASAAWRGWLLASANATESQAALAAPLPAALGPLLHPALRAQLAHELGRNSAALLLSLIDGRTPDGAPESWRDTTVQLEALVAHTLGMLGTGGPLLLWLDDVHWADPALWPLIAGLCHTPSAKLRLLLCARSRELRENEAAWRALRGLEADGRMQVMSLRGLEVAELVSMAASLGRPIEIDAARDLARRSGGNPLVARVQLLHASIPGATNSLYDAQLISLDAHARQALEILALAGDGLEFDVWQRVLGSPAPATLLVTQGMLRAGESGYRLVHDLLRAEIVARMPAARASQIHVQLARALGDRADALTRARHFEAGQAWAEAAQCYIQAATQARRLGATTTVGPLLEDAARCCRHLGPDSPEQLRVRLAVLLQAQASIWTEAQIAEAEAVAGAATQQADLHVLVEVHMARMHNAGARSKFEEAEACAQQAREAATELGDPALALLAANGFWRMRTQLQLAHERDLPAIEQAIEQARALANPEALMALLLTRAHVLHKVDRLKECETCLDEVDALRAANPHALLDEIGLLRTRALVVAALHNDREAARAVQIQLLSRARLSGDFGSLRNSLISLRIIDTILGQLESATLWCEEMLRESIRRAGPDQPATQIARAFLVDSLLEQGEASRAREVTAPLREWLDAAPRDGFGAFLGWLALANIAREGTPDHAAAAAYLRRVLALPMTQGTLASVPMLILADDLHRAGVRDGEPAALIDKARALIDATRPSDELIFLDWVVHAVHDEPLALARARSNLFELALGIRTPAYRRDALTRRAFARKIHQAFEALPQPIRETVPLTDANGMTVRVTWTVDDGLTDAGLDGAALRIHRLKRLSLEANMAGAAVTHAALAGALRVSTRTVERDVAHALANGVQLHTLKRVMMETPVIPAR